ncbi:MAG: efflux RND transporter permease subunit [Putridiphycobacter sp.]|nr:efflux RND transporter permease subunit [Putridiphycobacter sp.]
MWIRLSQIILRNRILILSILLGLTIMFGYYAINNVKMDNKYGTMLPRDSDAKQNYLKLKALFSENESLLIFAIDNKDLYTLEKFNAWYELGKALQKYDAVDSVFSEAHIYQLSKNTEEKKFELDKIIKHKPERQKDLDSLKNVIKKNPFYNGLIYNDSTGSSLMMVFIDENIMNDMKKAVVLLDIEATAKTFEPILGEIRVSGMPHIRVSVGEKLKAELGLFIALTIIVTSLLLFIFFRSIKIVVICNVVVFVGVIWSLGTIGFFDFKLSILMVLIPPLMIVISIPNSIFLINKFHQEIKDHGNKVKALTRVIQKIGNATFLTNLTTAMGFATFIFTNSERLFEFGFIAALNIIMVFVLSITILPIILSYSAIPKPKHLEHLEKQWLHLAVEKLEYVTLYRRKIIFIGAGIVVLVAIIGALNIKATGNITGDLPQDDPITNDVQYLQDKFGGSIPFEILIDTKKKNAYLYRFDELEALQRTLNDYHVFSKSLSVADGVKIINMAYSGGNPERFEIPTLSKMNKFKPYLENASNDAGKNPFVDSTNIYTHITLQIQDLGSYEVQELIDTLGPVLRSIINPKKDDYLTAYNTIINASGDPKNEALSSLYFDRPEIYQNLITIISKDDEALRDEFLMDENKIYAYHNNKNFNEQLKSAIDLEEWELVFTGTAVVASNGTQYLVNNLFTSLAIAIVLIAILMSLLFRSWRMVIISLIPNLIPLLTTAGIMGIFGIPIKPSTLLVFSIAFGISVDDTIHFLAKFRQELKHHEHDLRRCILVALRETGISMIYTSIVLFFGFLVLAFSQFGGTKALGILVSLTLLIAMLSNLLILPSLLLFMQRKMSNKAIREPLFELYDEETDIELNHLEIEESLEKYKAKDLKQQKND